MRFHEEQLLPLSQELGAHHGLTPQGLQGLGV